MKTSGPSESKNERLHHGNKRITSLLNCSTVKIAENEATAKCSGRTVLSPEEVTYYGLELPVVVYFGKSN
jgi:hypothetical protein